MFKDNKENFYDNLDFMFVSIIPSKVRVGIIGGGKGAYIKAKSFSFHGCKVEAYAKDFIKEFEELDDVGIIKGEYKSEFIKDRHIVVIAVGKGELEEKIIEDCSRESKLFFTLSDFERGMGAVPAQTSLKNISFALNTKDGNPKASVMLREKIKCNLQDYDEFIGFINNLRNKAKKLERYKSEVINFIATEDYKFIWEKGKAKEGLLLFFPEYIISELFD